MGSQRVRHDVATNTFTLSISLYIYVYHIFIHSSANGHGSCFHGLTFVDIAVKTIGMHVSFEIIGFCPSLWAVGPNPLISERMNLKTATTNADYMQFFLSAEAVLSV